MMAVYGYQPLSPTSDEIRVAVLWPGTASDAIEVTLHHVHLIETAPPFYEALSYVWGTEESPRPITVKGTGSSEGTLQVSQNLYDALCHLRCRSHPRALWIDAICIDQSDVAEKSVQVMKMANTYKLAARVVIWLGPEKHDSTAAVEFLDDFGRCVDLDLSDYTFTVLSQERYQALKAELVKSESSLPAALSGLLTRPWFERLWVVQEAMLANSERSVVQCGASTVLWQTFLKGLVCMEQHFQNQPRELSRVLFIRNFYLRSIKNRFLEDLMSFGQLLKCKDERDKIYAMLGLIADDFPITVDYTLPYPEVYKNVFLSYLATYERIHLLTWCEMRNDSSVTPTWVPDWSRPRELHRIEGTALYANFVAEATIVRDRILRVGGIMGARITKCIPICLPGNGEDVVDFKSALLVALGLLEINVANLRTTAYRPGSISSLLDAFCCALACSAFVEPEPPIPDLPTLIAAGEELLSYLSAEEPVQSNSYFWRLIKKYATGRTIIFTEGGFIGLGPAKAECGDVVCALLGCRSSMVLRPNSESQFQVVGECYPHEMSPTDILLGTYPAGFKQVFQYNPSTLLYEGKHRDESTGTLSCVDPRLRGLHKADTEPYRFAPPTTAAELQSLEVNIQYFDLV